MSSSSPADSAGGPPVSAAPEGATEPNGAGAALGEAEPAGAAAVFGAEIARARRYAQLLADDGIVRGLIGPGELDRLWSRHLLNSAALAPLLPPGAALVDAGSGAGLPGIPLALLRPDCSLTLLDAALRRATFLREAVAALDLPCSVVQARVEQWRGLGAMDAVVTRAMAPLDRLLLWLAPALQRGLAVFALVGEADAAKIRRGELPVGLTVALHEVEVAGALARTVELRYLGAPPAAATGRNGRGGRRQHPPRGPRPEGRPFAGDGSRPPLLDSPAPSRQAGDVSRGTSPRAGAGGTGRGGSLRVPPPPDPGTHRRAGKLTGGPVEGGTPAPTRSGRHRSHADGQNRTPPAGAPRSGGARVSPETPAGGVSGNDPTASRRGVPPSRGRQGRDSGRAALARRTPRERQR